MKLQRMKTKGMPARRAVLAVEAIYSHLWRWRAALQGGLRWQRRSQEHVAGADDDGSVSKEAQGHDFGRRWAPVQIGVYQSGRLERVGLANKADWIGMQRRKTRGAEVKGALEEGVETKEGRLKRGEGEGTDLRIVVCGLAMLVWGQAGQRARVGAMGVSAESDRK